MKSEKGVIQLQARESLDLPEAGKSKEEFSHRGFGGSVALRTL